MLCRKPFVNDKGAFPCGQCGPCRMNRRRVLQHRIMLENMCHGDSVFLTLTYEDLQLVYNVKCRLPELVPRHLMLFMKRLREAVSPVKIRFYGVGEYGDISERPHYHVLVFGLPGCARGNTERDLLTKEPNMNCCAQCRLIYEKWGHGHVFLGNVTRDSASYVAGYCVKGMTARDDRRLKGRFPEFSRASNRPGIGADAMWDVASVLMQHGLRGDDVPAALRFEGKSWPLGRYLRQKLRVMIGREKNAPQSVLDEKKAELQIVRDVLFALEGEAPRLRLSQLLSEMSDGEFANWKARAELWKQRKVAR